jgi:hypothetical protein
MLSPGLGKRACGHPRRFNQLNPAAITRKITTIQSQLLDSARDRTTIPAQA